MFIRMCLFLTIVSLIGLIAFPILMVVLSNIMFLYLSGLSFISALIGVGLLGIIGVLRER